jgi:hypothetical protein
VFSLVVMSVIAVVAVQVSLSDREASWAVAGGERAHFAAQAGANQTWANWPAAASTLAPGDSVDLGWRSLPDGLQYHAVITRVDSGSVQEVRVMRVEGRGPGVKGGQRVVELWSTKGANLFPKAIGARGNLKIDNDAIVDSYDSKLGPYGGANIDDEGDVHANGNVDITNNSTVSGAASATGAVTTATGGTATQGISSGAAPHDYPPVHCPTSGYTKAADLPPGPYSYNEMTGDLTVDNKTLDLPTGTYYFNNVLVKKPSGKLGPIPGDEVVMHVEGALTLANQGRLNADGFPPDLMVYGCGTSLDLWSLNQNSLAWAALYAPEDDIVVENDSDVFGAVVGRNVTIWKGGSGPVSVHYDEALGAVQAGGTRRLMVRPWAQIAR